MRSQIAPLKSRTVALHWQEHGYLVAVGATLVIVSGVFDPDFEAYQTVFNLSGAWLSDAGRDPLFLTIIGFASESLEYGQFRILLDVVFVVLLHLLMKLLSAIRQQQLGLANCLLLTPFILLKLHVQFREGLALFALFLAVTAQQGELGRSIGRPSFWVLAAMGCTLHSGSIPWWLTAVLIGMEHRLGRCTTLVMLIFLFMFVGAFAVGEMGFLSETENAFASLAALRDTQQSDELNASKLLYRVSLMGIAPFTWIVYNASIIELPHSRVSSLSYLGATGLIGAPALLLGAFIGSMFFQASEGSMSAILRLSQTGLMFLAIQFTLLTRRTSLPWALLAFLLIDTSRNLYVAISDAN